ncbi:glutamate-5-semialdehyde dehydrogenase [Mesobacillus zeae]|uniref:Gamma-glutamyl phosphate reductase n=1 Tax=Mesobacillus zeae TaxID=1917180 RepID=A0A398B889_9BACI|nr:glutamate-5-semialdehyde dehydrogenase [Mesobacillus zeae]RID85711.1 glutamate-5-semialdehyde dehydrogenase [Mesobacillus zeae]
MGEALEKAKLAKESSKYTASLPTEVKNHALECIANELLLDMDDILAENARDLEAGRQMGLTESVLDRIRLSDDRIREIAEAVRQLIQLGDPIGEVLETIKKENGLVICQKRVPLGVIGMIYEARPNVTVDAAALSLKTGNAVILRGSSSSIYSNIKLVSAIRRALIKSGIPENAVQLIEDSDRETAKELFYLNEYLDVLIPRGGKKLIQTVLKESTVPVLETGAGNCHIYIDDSADPEMAENIVLNAKVQRPSVCNAVETVLISDCWFSENGSTLLEALRKNGVDLIGDKAVCKACQSVEHATEEDWHTEYLSLRVSLKITKTIEEAVDHINKYGTKHSEAIITEDETRAQYFMDQVDAAAVYHNSSTRFTDGFEFGYGAEIGISTQKLHARGPMGLKALTSSKFFMYGSGQIRN